MKRKILIIDDSLTVRMDLQQAFESAGYGTTVCPALEQARGVLKTEKCDLILLDVLLPDGDGIDFLRELKASELTARLPVMFLSSDAEIRDRIRGMSTGADEYVGKPYDISYVIARARELLARTESAAAPVSGMPMVLVIDDSVTFREELRARLEASGYRVRLAETGEIGLSLAVTLRPDVVVVDGILPGIDGAGVVKRMRQDAVLRRTPCLVLTGSTLARDESVALDAGADTYVRKEEGMEVIIARLAALLRSSKSGASAAGLSGISLLGPKRILAVDDSPTYLHEVSSALREDGYEVVPAKSGEEALALLEAQSVNCILLDLLMPGLSGQDTCLRIKARPEWRDIPLLMLTASEDRETMLEGFKAGADDFISKSGAFEVLKARLLAQLRRKQFEDEHRRMGEELRIKAAEAAEARANRSLAETRAKLLLELERSNRDLEAFSSSISHDLRAPIRGILGFTRSALRENGELMTESGRERLNRVIVAAERMERLISALLEFSMLARKALSRNAVDLSRMVEGLLGDLKRADPSRAVRTSITEGILVKGDESLLSAAFGNLLGNAWKFTSKCADARIEFGVTESAEGPVYFVRDNGAGFDMRYSKKLFGVFQRLHSSAEFDGTGVGLATVQRIIQRHGGRIWAEGEVGKGATFYLTISGKNEEGT